MNAPFFVSWLFQILTNVKGTHARTGAFAQIWLPTIPANAQGSTWGGIVNTVSAHVSHLCFSFNSFTTINSFLTAHTPDGLLVIPIKNIYIQHSSVHSVPTFDENFTQFC